MRPFALMVGALTRCLAVSLGASWCGMAFAGQTALVGWGDNRWGQLNVPENLTNVVQVAGGWAHTLALREDGTVAAWGAGTNGQWGWPFNGQSIVPPGLSNVIGVAAGADHSAALKAGGTVVGWGDNYWGQTNVPAGLSNVIAIAAGAQHTLASRADLTVAAWGAGSTNDFRYPVYSQSMVPADLSQVVAVAAGAAHSVALKSDGTVVAWGYNIRGQTNVPAGLTDVIGIAAGDTHTLALKSDGTVVGWGRGLTNSGTWPDFGQATPPAGLSNVVSVHAGGTHSVAVKSDGTAVAWGDNQLGQLNVPVGLSGIRAMSCGGSHNVALVSDVPPVILQQPKNQTIHEGRAVTNSVLAAGSAPLSYQWQLNGAEVPGETNSSLLFPEASAALAGVYRVAVSNPYGVTWSEETTLTVTFTPPLLLVPPTNVTTYPGGVAQFSVVCDGAAPISYQWQRAGISLIDATNATLVLDPVRTEESQPYSVIVSNAYGVVTSSNVFAVIPPVLSWGPYYQHWQSAVPANLSNVATVSAGSLHAVALHSNGTVSAWGDNSVGQADVPAGLSNVVAITCGSGRNVALHDNGRVTVWGGSGPVLSPPISVTSVVAVAASPADVMILRADGSVGTWGNLQFIVQPEATNAVAIAFGGNTALVLRADGTVVSFGPNFPLPVPAAATNVVAIAAGPRHCMALKRDGTLVSWGDAPPEPPGLTNVVAMDVGDGISIVLLSDGTVVQWPVQSGFPWGITNAAGVFCGYSQGLVLTGPPLVPPRLLTPTFKSNTMSFSVQTARGMAYRLEYKTPGSDRWFMRPPVPGDGTIKTLVDPDARDSQRVYRVWQSR